MPRANRSATPHTRPLDLVDGHLCPTKSARADHLHGERQSSALHREPTWTCPLASLGCRTPKQCKRKGWTTTCYVKLYQRASHDSTQALGATCHLTCRWLGLRCGCTTHPGIALHPLLFLNTPQNASADPDVFDVYISLPPRYLTGVISAMLS